MTVEASVPSALRPDTPRGGRRITSTQLKGLAEPPPFLQKLLDTTRVSFRFRVPSL